MTLKERLLKVWEGHPTPILYHEETGKHYSLKDVGDLEGFSQPKFVSQYEDLGWMRETGYVLGWYAPYQAWCPITFFGHQSPNEEEWKELHEGFHEGGNDWEE